EARDLAGAEGGNVDRGAGDPDAAAGVGLERRLAPHRRARAARSVADERLDVHVQCAVLAGGAAEVGEHIRVFGVHRPRTLAEWCHASPHEGRLLRTQTARPYACVVRAQARGSYAWAATAAGTVTASTSSCT